MPIIRSSRPTSDFTVMRNQVINDRNLSFEALGLLNYLLSKPDDWIVRFNDISARGGCGAEKTRRIIKECMDAGYMKIDNVRGESGKMLGTTYSVYDQPQSFMTKNARDTGFPSLGKAEPILRTESVANKKESNLPTLATLSRQVDQILGTSPTPADRDAERDNVPVLSAVEALRRAGYVIEDPDDQAQSIVSTGETTAQTNVLQVRDNFGGRVLSGTPDTTGSAYFQRGQRGQWK